MIEGTRSDNMQLGFVIDQTSCIGCHACTVACKQENAVPVGVFRTWVKYVEKRRFPDTERSFAVLRCNQCSRPPCVAICPTGALHKRPDGIVDLDRDACIGCRACMSACPYEALHVDAARGVASKCHMCAHRLEKNLAPACVTVCPTNAIRIADFHDGSDPLVHRVRSGETLVRRPEKRTGPNVHYVGASIEALSPEAAHRGSAWLWSERAPGRPEVVGVGSADAQVVMEPVHEVPWGAMVPTFLLIKGTEAGFALDAPFTSLAAWLAPLIGALGTLVAALLMLADLRRPERWHLMFARGNSRSWLVRGAWILGIYGMLQATGLALALGGMTFAATGIEWVAVACAPVVAGYSGALFGQCEGREMWRSPLVLPRMLVQAVAAGASLATALGQASFAPWAVAGFIAYLGLGLAFRSGNGASALYLRRARPLGLAPLPVVVAGAVLAGLGALHPALAAIAIAALLIEDLAWVRSAQLPANS
ncbi:MAG: 4Fe-4S dicluster domain-containing protein [Steroidobacteraceae bacterium]